MYSKALQAKDKCMQMKFSSATSRTEACHVDDRRHLNKKQEANDC